MTRDEVVATSDDEYWAYENEVAALVERLGWLLVRHTYGNPRTSNYMLAEPGTDHCVEVLASDRWTIEAWEQFAVGGQVPERAAHG